MDRTGLVSPHEAYDILVSAQCFVEANLEHDMFRVCEFVVHSTVLDHHRGAVLLPGRLEYFPEGAGGPCSFGVFFLVQGLTILVVFLVGCHRDDACVKATDSTRHPILLLLLQSLPYRRLSGGFSPHLLLEESMQRCEWWRDSTQGGSGELPQDFLGCGDSWSLASLDPHPYLVSLISYLADSCGCTER